MRVRSLLVIPLFLLSLPVVLARADTSPPAPAPVAVSTGPTTRIDWAAIHRYTDLAQWYATAAAQPPPKKSATSPTSTRLQRVVYGTGACGGDLPPCWVMMRESGGNLNAYNPTGCGGRGCYGKWQFDPRTGDGTGTEAEQDAEARRVWDGGRGCGNWAACG